MSAKPILAVIPGTPGAARVEYYACREDVEAMIAKGYNVRMAYRAMKDQGRVTCSYSAFADYVRGNGKRLHSKKGKRPKAAAQTPSARTLSPSGKEAFDIGSVDVSKLI